MKGQFSIDLFRLDGRVAIATGAASGMGRCAAFGFADAGAHVVAADINPEGLKKLVDEMGEYGYDITTVVTDISEEDMVKDMVKTALEVNGRIDILLNCAGIGARGIAEEYPFDLWQKVTGVNTRGSFLCAKAVAPTMIAQRKGSIINIASCGAAVGWPGSVGYQASKAGLGQMSRSLAVEWGPYNVRVNAIAPGYVDTPQTQVEAAREPDYFAERLRRVPMARASQPEEVVGAILFLASDASSMVTGNLVATDGGYIAS
jgi:NAD(P)-dependent dehydrogenase (short-subunit alcohol dehydrogenase family)